MIIKFIFKYIKYKNVKMPGVTIKKNNKKISQLTSIDSPSYLSSISAYSWVPIATYIDDGNPTTYTNYKVNLSTILNSSYEASKEFITSYVVEKTEGIKEEIKTEVKDEIERELVGSIQTIVKDEVTTQIQEANKDIIEKVDYSYNAITTLSYLNAINTVNITKNTNAIAANSAAINKNTDAIGTQAVVTPATITEQFTGLVPDANNTYFLADGAGKPVAVDDIKEGGIYYIYKKTYNSDPHDEQNVTISLVRQADAGEGKDFTYPSITTHSTGLYQYIDNHIKNFDLSWQILD